jgi:hypothetical protein
MDMNGSERIEAPVNAVWRALNDPEVLKACIPAAANRSTSSPTPR